MRQALLKKLLWIPKKKKRNNEKEKKKSLLVYVYFSLFFFLMKQFNWSIVYSFFSVLASCGVTPSTAIIFTSTTYPQDLNFKKMSCTHTAKKEFFSFSIFQRDTEMNFALQVHFSVICIHSLSKLGRSEQYFMFQFCVLSLFNSLSKKFSTKPNCSFQRSF